MSDNTPNSFLARFPLYFAPAFSLLLALAYYPGQAFDRMENSFQDWLTSVNASRLSPGDPRIVIAAVDNDSVREWGWPFTRDVYAQLLDRLTALGAKTIALDLLIENPNKLKPEGDFELVKATRRCGRAIYAAELSIGENSAYQIHMPLPPLTAAAKAVGFATNDRALDSDGRLRRVQLFSSDAPDPLAPGLPFKSLAAAAAADYTGTPPAELARAVGTGFQTLTLRKMARRPFRPGLGAGAPRSFAALISVYRYISVADILAGSLSPEEQAAIKDGLVFVGSTIQGFYDHYATPFNRNQPAVEFHANAVDNLLHGDFARRVERKTTVLALAAFVWTPMLLLDLDPLASAAAVLALLAAWLGAVEWQFLRHVRLEYAAPAVGLVLSYTALAVEKILFESSEKRRIQQTFGQFVAPEVVRQLVRDPGQARLGGRKREMSVMFLDVAGFTSISERLDPDALIKFLNRYLTGFTRVIHRRKGVVDKYIGDCVMAFWNAPFDQPGHQALACLAALECQELLLRLNLRGKQEVPVKPSVRIGLNTGLMNVGFTGAPEKLQYTVLGDEVNLASRLEGVNKFFGTRILASQACVLAAAQVVDARLLGSVLVVGKQVPVKVYEVFAKKGQWRGMEEMRRFEEGVAAYQACDFAGAAAKFEAVLRKIPEDRPSRLYLGLCREHVAVPPQKGWETFNLSSK